MKFQKEGDPPIFQLSRPVRALWIEIKQLGTVTGAMGVEAREGLVD